MSKGESDFNKLLFKLHLIAAIIFVIATFDWDYDFYYVFRYAITIGMGWLAFMTWSTSFASNDTFTFISSIVKALLAFFFMPKEFSFGIYLDKEGWVILDIISAIFMAVCAFKALKQKE